MLGFNNVPCVVSFWVEKFAFVSVFNQEAKASS